MSFFFKIFFCHSYSYLFRLYSYMHIKVNVLLYVYNFTLPIPFSPGNIIITPFSTSPSTYLLLLTSIYIFFLYSYSHFSCHFARKNVRNEIARILDCQKFKYKVDLLLYNTPSRIPFVTIFYIGLYIYMSPHLTHLPPLHRMSS